MLLLSLFAGAAAKNISLTLRNQHMSKVGRQEWIAQSTAAQWVGEETAIIVVDMWNQHWCQSATTRVGGLAIPMNQTITAARALGIQIIFAPSDVTGYYAGTPERKNVLELPNVTVPTGTPVNIPPRPLNTSTNGGCDVDSPQGSPWTRQIDTLTITDEDFLITAEEGASEQELINVLTAKKIKNLIYMGVHENMCIVDRPFALDKIVSWGWGPSNCAVMRELVDVMYTPKDSPYVSHAEGVELQTAWIEKFLVSSVSMYDILGPSYFPGVTQTVVCVVVLPFTGKELCAGV